MVLELVCPVLGGLLALALAGLLALACAYAQATSDRRYWQEHYLDLQERVKKGESGRNHFWR
jgi:hypothetical protein